MAKFNKANFVYDGMYLMYRVDPAKELLFVARFKRGGKADFQKFLVEHFEVDEYFMLLKADKMTPLGALETKGYVSPTTKKLLQSLGYSANFEGKRQYLEDAVKRYR